MKTERLKAIFGFTSVALTIINLTVLAFLVIRSGSLTASAVVQARRFELVDDQGRVRAQILITRPVTMPDGKYYAEGVLFRLIDQNGRPGVKIGTSPDGSGMSLAGDSDRRDWSGVQILANGDASSVTLTNKSGSVEHLQP